MTSFRMPSAEARAQSAELDRVCRELELCDLLGACRLAGDAFPQVCLDELRGSIREETVSEIADLLEGLQAVSRIKDLNVISNVRAYGKNTSPQRIKGA